MVVFESELRGHGGDSDENMAPASTLAVISDHQTILGAYPPGVLFPIGTFVGVVWREDPPLGTLSTGSERPPAEEVLL